MELNPELLEAQIQNKQKTTTETPVSDDLDLLDFDLKKTDKNEDLMNLNSEKNENVEDLLNLNIKNENKTDILFLASENKENKTPDIFPTNEDREAELTSNKQTPEIEEDVDLLALDFTQTKEEEGEVIKKDVDIAFDKDVVLVTSPPVVQKKTTLDDIDEFSLFDKLKK